MLAREDGLDCGFLKWAQGLPAQAVDDVVLDGWVEALEGTHSFSSMSSTSVAPRALRSTSVSSASSIVSA